ncbi:MAG TPA: nuclear transport factor 2 family protein [Novosphingobium sp.]|nr:nuclear transport factor 2 family protein [Novosphingobium sp.]
MSLEDESIIRNLVSKLAFEADGDDIEEYISHFTADAEWIFDSPARSARVVGRDDIKAAALQRRAEGAQGAGSHTRHAVTTLTVDIDGDHATARCYLLVLKTAQAAPVVSGMVVYDDRYRRTDGGWKLARRKISPG